MQGSKASVSITVNGRTSATEYKSGSNTFIEGRAGSEFEIEIRNHTASRVMAIVSVDGLSVINGDPASPESPGYVIAGYGSIKIPGWKLNGKSAAKFTFSGKRDSYSQLSSGASHNCGVIGVMVWSEKPVVVPQFSVTDTLPSPWGGVIPKGPIVRGIMTNSVDDGTFNSYTATVNTAQLSADVGLNKAVAQAATLNNLGTSFGKPTDFKTVSTTFEKDSVLETLVMYYDDARGLKARGIEVTRERGRSLETPDPFPGMSCKPPSNW